jgi:hypothetical protein
MDEAIEFYREAFAKEGLTEYELLTSIEDEGFSMVFTGWHSGEELVIQGVVMVELIDTEGVYHEIYTGEPEDKSDECPYTLSIQIPKANYLVTGVKITIDQSVIPATWNEIDAVELVGVVE